MSVLNSRATVCCHLNESVLVDLQRIASVDSVSTPTPSLCGKPGSWRNRSARCEYGFEHNDPNVTCPVHSSGEYLVRAQKNCSVGQLRRPKHTLRASILRALLESADPLSLSEISARTQVSYSRVKPCVRELRMRGHVAGHGGIIITSAGQVRLVELDAELQRRQDAYDAKQG